MPVGHVKFFIGDKVQFILDKPQHQDGIITNIHVKDGKCFYTIQPDNGTYTAICLRDGEFMLKKIPRTYKQTPESPYSRE